MDKCWQEELKNNKQPENIPTKIIPLPPKWSKDLKTY